MIPNPLKSGLEPEYGNGYPKEIIPGIGFSRCDVKTTQQRGNPIDYLNRIISVFIAAAVILCFLFTLDTALAAGLNSAVDAVKERESPWKISADRLTYMSEKQVYVAEGNVIISKEDQSLYTRHAAYDIATGTVTLSGGLRLETDGDTVRGKEGTFNLNTRTGRIVDGALFLERNHYYINGRLLEKVGEDTYVIQDCSVTTCDGDNPDWRITGSKVRVTIEGYGTIKKAAFRVRGLPIVYIPYMIFPAKTRRQTGLLPPRLGYSTLNGGDIEVPFFWAISDQADATFYQRYMSQRGYMQGVEFRYLADENSKGVLEFDILSDLENQKNMSDGDALDISPYERTNRTRYWLRGMADQDLPLGVEARLDADYVSDQDYLREFENSLFGFATRTDLADEFHRPFEEKRSPTRRSALRLSHDTDAYTLQGMTSYYQYLEDPADKDQIHQPLGGLDFIFMQEQIRELPVFFNVESNYDYMWSDKETKGHSLSISPEVTFPFWMGPYVEFEPSLRYTYNALRVDEIDGTKENRYQSAYEARARLATNAAKVFEVNGSRTKKVRHKISPALYYTYRGYGTDQQEESWFNPIDYDDYGSPWFDFMDQGEEEDLSRNRISLALENFLGARLEDQKGKVHYRQWSTFKLIQGYDIDKARDSTVPGEEKKPFTPLAAQLTVTPFPAMDLRVSTAWDHYDHQFSRTTLSGELTVQRTGGREDRYALNYQDYAEDEDGQTNLNLKADINLVHGLSVGGSLQRDLDKDHNILTAGWIGYQSQCWGIKLGAEREYKTTNVLVVLRLVGLGDTGEW
ncbi:MAG: LPS assembly protein LptD [Desulfatiglandaceae bacterium]